MWLDISTNVIAFTMGYKFTHNVYLRLCKCPNRICKQCFERLVFYSIVDAKQAVFDEPLPSSLSPKLGNISTKSVEMANQVVNDLNINDIDLPEQRQELVYDVTIESNVTALEIGNEIDVDRIDNDDNCSRL